MPRLTDQAQQEILHYLGAVRPLVERLRFFCSRISARWIWCETGRRTRCAISCCGERAVCGEGSGVSYGDISNYYPDFW